jgi:hypothetical protein
LTTISSCGCKSEYQDKKYGKGQRLMNRKTKTGHDHEATCTVCGKVHSVFFVKTKTTKDAKVKDTK